MKFTKKPHPDTLENFLSRVEVTSSDIEKVAANVEELKQTQNRLLTEPCQSEREKHLVQQATLVHNNKVLGKLLHKAIKEERQRLDKIEASGNGGSELQVRRTQVSAITKRYLEVWTQYNNTQLEFREKNKKMLLRNIQITDPNSNISTEELEAKLDAGDMTVLSSIIKDTDQAKDELQQIETRHKEMVRLEKGIAEVHEMFLDLSRMVELQGEQVDRIDLTIGQAVDHVEQGRDHLRQAEVKKRSARKKKFILAGIIAGISLVILLILIFSLL